MPESERAVKPAVVAALYVLGVLLAWPLARNIWYLPAGLRLGTLWILPRRQWPWLLAAEWLTLLAMNAWRGHDFSRPGLWIVMLLPWPCYAVAVALLRKDSMRIGTDTPLIFPRLIAAGVLGAMLIAPWLARFHPATSSPSHLLASGLEFILGDLFGVLMVAPPMVLFARRGFGTPQQREAMRAVLLYLLPVLALSALLAIRAVEFAPLAYLVVFAPLLYIAFRYGCSGAALAVPCVGLALELTRDYAPGITAPALQLSLVAIGSGALMLGAATTALRNSHWLLAERNRELLHKNENLQSLTIELRDMAQRLARLQEQGQRELAAELHDELGQGITALATRIALAQRACPPGATAQALYGLREQAREVHDSLRRALRQLRPAVLDKYGLSRALSDGPPHELAEDAGIAYRVQFRGDIDVLSEDVTTAIYRICQEAVTNCVRHAHARNFWIELTVTQLATDNGHWVELVLADDGGGFGPHADVEGHGLSGIRSRVAALSGDYSFQTDGNGTRHCIVIHTAAAYPPFGHDVNPAHVVPTADRQVPGAAS